MFGVGAGYLHQEFAALGVDFASRGARTDEYIDVLRNMWRAEKPSFQGKYINYENIDAQPRPVQPDGPPVIIGGASPAAMRRTITHGDGWYGFALDVATTAKAVDALKLAQARFERPANLGEIELSLTPPKPPTKSMMEDYAALGIERLIPMLGFYKEDNILSELDKLANELL